MTTSRQLYSSPMSSNARRNPYEKIPVLIEGDFVLWESNAINQHLHAHVARIRETPAWRTTEG